MENRVILDLELYDELKSKIASLENGISDLRRYANEIRKENIEFEKENMELKNLIFKKDIDCIRYKFTFLSLEDLNENNDYTIEKLCKEYREKGFDVELFKTMLAESYKEYKKKEEGEKEE